MHRALEWSKKRERERERGNTFGYLIEALKGLGGARLHLETIIIIIVVVVLVAHSFIKQ